MTHELSLTINIGRESMLALILFYGSKQLKYMCMRRFLRMSWLETKINAQAIAVLSLLNGWDTMPTD